MTVGVFCDEIEVARDFKNCGVRYLAYSVDTGIFAQACSRIVQDLG